MIVIQLEGFEKIREVTARQRRRYEKKCLSCGACCSYYAWTARKMPFAETEKLASNNEYAFNAPTLTKYLYADGVKQIVKSITWFLRRKKEGGWWKCKALDGNVGQSVKCSVYEQRPATCSEFPPGSLACIKARQWAGLEAS
jgi:Fe-S-cluster containining protein